MDDESDDDEDEPLYIKMLENQLSKKKTVKERLEMNQEISAEELKQELQREGLKQKTASTLARINEKSYNRMIAC